MVEISATFLYEISSQILAFHQLCDYLGLNEEQRKNPNCGQWIIDYIREMHSDYLIRKEISLATKIPIDKVLRNPLIRSSAEDSGSGNKENKAAGINADKTA